MWRDLSLKSQIMDFHEEIILLNKTTLKKTRLTFTTVYVKLEKYCDDKWNLPVLGKCQDANCILVWTMLKERLLCMPDSDKWLPKKIRPCLPISFISKTCFASCQTFGLLSICLKWSWKIIMNCLLS